MSEVCALSLERMLIHIHGRRSVGGGILHNLTEGGNGTSGLGVRPVTAFHVWSGGRIGEFTSIVQAANHFGYIPSTVFKSASRTNIRCGNHIFRYSDDDMSDVTSICANFIKILVYDMNNNKVIGRTTTIKEAGKLAGVSEAAVNFILKRDGYYSANGHTFVWLTPGWRKVLAAKCNGYNNRHKQSYRGVRAFRTNGEFVGAYESLTSCRNELDVSTAKITEVCQGKRRQCKGYYFEYTDSD